ncbi:MAG: hypothetical protein RQ751_00985 [Longimicrobiales bacterium]|nr:hypothetical protein [Longimicrobiales bacterium]
MLKKIENPVEFLTENGVLFEVNRQVLHPLGLELQIHLDPEGNVTGIELLDNRDNPEPIFFSPEAFLEGREKYQRYLREAGRRNIQKRRQLGVVIQTGPNLPHQFHDVHYGDDEE